MTSTSTSVTTVGGVVIVTQVIPKDSSSSIALQTPGSAAPMATPPPVKVPPTPTKEDNKASIFLRGEPQGLGVVQIFIGLLSVLFSLTALCSPALVVYAPFGLAVVFVVSGSLAVAAGRRSSVRLVWASLLSNALSALLGLAGVVYVCWLLAAVPPAEMFCNFQPSVDTVFTDDGRWKCIGRLWLLNNILYGLLGLHLVLFVLQICVSTSVSVLSGKVIRRYKRYSPFMVEGDDAKTLLYSAPSEHDGEENRFTESP